LPRVVGILREEMGAGLALTGMDVMTVKDAEDFKRTMQTVIDSHEYGLAVVDENLLAGLDERSRSAITERSLPLVVPIPGTLKWEDVTDMPEDDYIAMLIRRAVGYQLNIQL
jgi:vacuolar-type H+-ATPase subunit F/Vma7